jgi:hypothetical protein
MLDLHWFPFWGRRNGPQFHKRSFHHKFQWYLPIISRYSKFSLPLKISDWNIICDSCPYPMDCMCCPPRLPFFRSHVLCTNSAQLDTSTEAAQAFLEVLWNHKIPYPLHSSPQLVPLLSQANSVHTKPLYLRKIHFNIILQTKMLRLPDCPIPSGFPINILCIHTLFYACYMPWPC